MDKKKGKPEREVLIEEKLSGGTKSDREFTRGETFVEEPTGSATMVNLDRKQP